VTCLLQICLHKHKINSCWVSTRDPRLVGHQQPTPLSLSILVLQSAVAIKSASSTSATSTPCHHTVLKLWLFPSSKKWPKWRERNFVPSPIPHKISICSLGTTKSSSFSRDSCPPSAICNCQALIHTSKAGWVQGSIHHKFSWQVQIPSCYLDHYSS
jgi:hypothetical protein